ncbi:dihydropteroate synthase [Lacticaseibacillus absianus]|uniref:dihydropteroate synthase n=1 Tax=Lacticaseibacillus absianus TaxID=2729623 RepID=UPI0015C8C775|nr:dihydropteroate synthase [Lacticaseibacillus absianus]
MQFTELTTPTTISAQTDPLQATQQLADTLLQTTCVRDRQVLLAVTTQAAEQAALAALFDRLDLIHTPTRVLVPHVALPVLQAALAPHWPQAAAQIQAIDAAHRIHWQAGRFSFDVSARPLVYGILNVSPDSFYDGGRFVAKAAMQAQVAKMIAAGVDVIEVGGQTTRPGFTEISPEVELTRIVPVLDFLRRAFPDLPLAVDTYKYPVMVQALKLGVDIVNDVTGFTDDPRKLTRLADSPVGLLTMHSNRDREYQDLTREMNAFFTRNLADLTAAGIARTRIALDQGIGYAQVADGQQDYTMMRNLDQLNHFQRPLMVAISRKGFGARLFGLAKDDRLPVTLVAEAAMVLKGGNILRVHDVAETVQLVKMLRTIETAYWLG